MPKPLRTPLAAHFDLENNLNAVRVLVDLILQRYADHMVKNPDGGLSDEMFGFLHDLVDSTFRNVDESFGRAFCECRELSDCLKPLNNG